MYQPRQWLNPCFKGRNKKLEYQRGDTILHFAGTKEKHPGIGKWLDNLDQIPEEFEIPIYNLTLRADIARIWTYLNNARILLDKASELQSDNSHIQMFQYNLLKH